MYTVNSTRHKNWHWQHKRRFGFGSASANGELLLCARLYRPGARAHSWCLALSRDRYTYLYSPPTTDREPILPMFVYLASTVLSLLCNCVPYIHRYQHAHRDFKCTCSILYAHVQYYTPIGRCNRCIRNIRILCQLCGLPFDRHFYEYLRRQCSL